MSSDPSWPRVQCFPNLTLEKRVMGNAIGNRLITVSIQAHPLSLNERPGSVEGEAVVRRRQKEMNIIVYQQ